MAVINAFFVLLFLCLLSKGNCQCSLDEIAINQTTTGKEVNGKQEWIATITNNCVCSQYSVKLDCNGFNTVEKVDESLLMVAGSICLLNNGLPIFKSDPISFTYAWDIAFPFNPLFSQTDCDCSQLPSSMLI